MSEPLSFPRPAFSPEQVEQTFDFNDIMQETISKIVRQENQAIAVLAEVAVNDETKPGIIVRVKFAGLFQDTYQFETEVAFDESVPRGEVHYAPAPTGWLQP